MVSPALPLATVLTVSPPLSPALPLATVSTVSPPLSPALPLATVLTVSPPLRELLAPLFAASLLLRGAAPRSTPAGGRP